MVWESDTSLFGRRDRTRLRERPYLWSQDALPLCGIAGLWLATVCVGALVVPIPQSSTTIFLLLAYMVGIALTMTPVFIIILTNEAFRLLPGPIYPWPAEELLAVPLRDRVRVAYHWCLAAALLIASLRLPYEIMIWRTAASTSVAELVDDLNTINSGLAKCAVLYPRSQAALNRRPLPMSTAEIKYLLDTDRRFVDPRSLDVTNSTTTEDPEIERMDRAIQKYLPLSAKTANPDAPNSIYFRRHRNDLDLDVTPDPRSQVEQICSRIGLRDLREVDAVVSRILEAQRVRGDFWNRIGRFASYAGIAIILTVTLVGIGMTECLLTIALSYFYMFGGHQIL